MENIVVFASGTATSGGSLFRSLVEASRQNILEAKIVAVISNHVHGSVFDHASKLGINFEHFEPRTDQRPYQEIMAKYQAEWAVSAGWLRPFSQMDPGRTINSHPGPLPEFGGKGMYGIHVYRAVLEAGSDYTELTTHFVTANYDDGPVIFRLRILLENHERAEHLQDRVKGIERYFYPRILNLVVNGQIHWNGRDPESLVLPVGYKIDQSLLDILG